MAFTENWVDILLAQVDADSPINETFLKAVRADLIFLKEYIGKGYTPEAAHTHNGIDSSILAPAVAGDNLVISSDAEISTVYGTYTAIKRIKIKRGGQYRIKFDFHGASGGYAVTAKARIYKNGSPIGIERIRTVPFDTYATYSEDLGGFNDNDDIEIYTTANGAGPYVRNFRIYATTFDVSTITL